MWRALRPVGHLTEIEMDFPYCPNCQGTQVAERGGQLVCLQCRRAIETNSTETGGTSKIDSTVSGAICTTVFSFVVWFAGVYVNHTSDLANSPPPIYGDVMCLLGILFLGLGCRNWARAKGR